MSSIKGTGIKILRKLFADREKALEQQFISRLNNEAKQKWEIQTLAVSWIPEEIIFNQAGPGCMAYEAAKVLFPGEFNHAIRELGKAMAKDGVPMFYQIFIRVPSPQFVLKRAAMLWRSLYDTGEAFIENSDKNQADFVLKNYPNYPSYMREYMVGYLQGMGEMLGIKDMKVAKVEDDPQSWRWKMKW